MRIIKIAQEEEFVTVEILVGAKEKKYKIMSTGLGTSCDKILEQIQAAENTSGIVSHNDEYLKPQPVAAQPAQQQQQVIAPKPRQWVQ